MKSVSGIPMVTVNRGAGFVLIFSLLLLTSCGGGGGGVISLLLAVLLGGGGSGGVSSNPPGIQCPGTCSKSFAQGTQVTLTASPAQGSVFAGWAGDCSGTNPVIIVALSAARNCTATFNLLPAPTRNLVLTKTGSGTVTSAPAGIACGAGCASQTAPFADNSTVALDAMADPGWRFTTWGGDCAASGVNPRAQITMDTDHSCSATFVQTFAITVTKIGTGTVTSGEQPPKITCGANCSALYDTGTAVTLTATPDVGWRLGSWAGCDSVNGNLCSLSATSDRNVTATFVPQARLTVNRTGSGTVTSSPSGIDCGLACAADFDLSQAVTLTAAEIPGWRFVGWTGCDAVNGNQCTVTMNADRTVGAQFAEQMALTLSRVGSGTVRSTEVPPKIDCGATCSADYDSGSTVVLTATPDAGWRFDSWTGCDSVNGNQCTVTVTGARSVTATFVRQFTLTVSKTGSGGVVSGEIPPRIDCGGVCAADYDTGTTVALTATPQAGWRFDSWTGCDAVNGNQCTVTMNAARTVTATFVQQFTLTVLKNGNGTVTSAPAGIDCGATCSALYDAGTDVVLTATPDAGWVLASWSGCSAVNGNQCTLTMNASRSATATFAAELRVTITGDGNVNIDPPNVNCTPATQPCILPYLSGTAVTLTATPRAGWRFDSWTGCDSVNTNQCSVAMNAPKQVSATFIQQFTLTVTKNGNGTVTSVPAGITCGATCSALYDAGTLVTLTATPDAGWRFDSWTGDADCADGTVTMDADKTCTATFVRQFALTVTKNGNGTVMSVPAGITCGATCSALYDAGTLVTLTATPDAGWRFDSWTGDADCADGTLTMDADKTCTATFVRQFALTVTKNGNGTVMNVPAGITCGATCSALYDAGTLVTLTATPDAGWTFTEWSGACSGANPVTDVLMDADKTCTATFTGPPPSAARLFVSDATNKLLAFDNPYTATGNVTPVQNISGSNTQLNNPRGLFYDSNANRMYVANLSANSILVFDSFTTLNGDVAPSRVISGASTGLNGPYRLALDDANDRLYVTNYLGDSVVVFNNASAANGNVAPARTISGATTQLESPTGISIDTGRNLLVVTCDAAAGGRTLFWDNAAAVNGNTPPNRKIEGSNANFATPIDQYYATAADHLYTDNYFGSFSNDVTVFHSASTADGNIAPNRTIDTNPFAFALGVFVDVGQNMMFLGMSSGRLGIYDNAITLNGTADANRLITGSNTQLGSPFGVFVSPIP
jgi:hypothetical protein